MLTLLFEQPIVFFIWSISFLLALSVHEFSHALVSNWLGDPTAKRLGRLTLNPAAHVDVFGFAAVVLVGFGWGKPVPYNPYNLKWQKWGPTAIAAAGPLSNLILALTSIFLLAFFGPRLGSGNLLVSFLYICTQLNIALLAFNLIPLPPLDGSKPLLSILSHPKYAAIRNIIELQGPTILFLLILADSFGNFGIFYRFFTWVSSLILRFTGIFGI